MIKKLLFLGCFLSLLTSLNAQTTLSAGDIAIIGTNYDVLPYEMTIVNLVPISAGTVIRITDYGYDEATGTFGNTSVTNTAEGSIAWTLTSAMPAGTVTKFSITGGATPNVSGLPGVVSVTGWTNTNTLNCPVPAGGDNWFVFQGSSTTSVDQFVFGFVNTFGVTFNGVNQPAGQFLVPGTGLQPNNGNSYLPPSLTLGSSAIALNRDPASGGYHGNNNVYTGTRSGSKAAILYAICLNTSNINTDNWLSDELTSNDINPGGAYFPGTNPIFTVTAPCALSLTAASQTNVSCFGGSNGAAAINTPTGGAGGYTYNWTPGNPTGDGTTSVTGLTAGTWTCTVTDANSCTTTQSFNVTGPAAVLAVTAASQTNVSCFGGSNGAASVNTPTGGTAGYTYNWTPGTPTGDGTTSITGLTAGTWTCNVTDANGCTATQSFNVTGPAAALAVTPASQTNVSCFGGSNGAASVNTPTGGTAGYTYNWTPGTPTGDGTTSITGLTAGTWTCTVTDANSCTTTQSFNVTGPAAALAVTPASQTNVSCFGGSNGAASVNTPTGGTAGYTYNWTPGTPTGDGTTSITGLTAGTWTCTVTDANGCTATQSFNVTGPAAALAVTPASQTNVSCFGGSNGAASVNTPTGGTAGASVNTPTGGAGGYTYNWTPGNPTGDGTTSVTGLTSGTWTCAVTDANGCTTEQSFTITQPTALVATAAAQTNVSCNGGSNGSATVNVSGGTSGYSYAWAPSGGTAATATGLSAGTYTVTVTDANGCSTTQGFTITQPTTIDFTTTVLSGYDYNTGYSQSIVASGGTGTKTYAVIAGSLPSGFSLSTAGQVTGISTQIADSNFTVSTTDANNCTATFNYVLKLNQIPVTVTATPSQTKVYGESDPVLTYTVSPSLLSGDSFTGSLTRVNGENIDNYAINLGSLSAGSKYLITYAGANFTITAKPITVTATASQTKVYGEIDPVIAYTVSPNLVGSDSFTGALTRVAGENTGTYGINQGSLSAGSNYTISYAGTNFTITAKPITVTATTSQTKVYGTTDPSFAYTLSPSLVGSDAFTGTLTRTAGENIGNYAITQGNLSAGSNYDISYVSKDFSITAKPITVTADASQTKVYGTANPVYSYTVSPSLVSGNSFTGALTRAAGENIGNYAITQGNLSAGANYNITYVSKDFTITAKPITVTANASQTKVYGTTNPVYSYTVSPNLVSGDSFTGALTRTAGENVGTYTIAQGTLSAGGNYTITYNGSNFTITKADQVITWNQTLGFGCNGETSIVLTAVSNSGLAVNYASSNANIASVSNNSLFFQNYGSATITASQAGNMNYNAAPAVILPVVASQPNLIRKQFENIIFFDNSSKNFKSYSWYKNGILVPGQTSQYFKENSALNGTYYAVATKLDGTLITSCPLTLSPTIEEEYMRIVPNPVRSNTTFQLMTNISASRIQNARVEVFNLTGNLLTTLNTSQNNIDMIAPIVEGIYIVKITLANGTYFTKNLLVRK
ncbi:MBG domain-containing protein [Flavobacterium sp. I-STPA6A]|uniref:MBG domain-containing protein n=1 Tax=Flavobacterium sp. I-STPA6A TaxID=2590450 RepID=UPI00131B0D08|nr:MBG domain-containing protein [Flavobacterium sp. I-STPA6A]